MSEHSFANDFLWAARFGFRAAPKTAVISTAFLLLAAAVPAISVWAVTMIANNLGRSSSPVLLLVFAGIVFGFSNALTQISYALSRMNAVKINVYGADRFDARLAEAHPSSFESPEFMKAVRNARSSIAEGHPSSQFQATINILCALVTASTLAWALWGFSPRAALISLLAPLPTGLAYAWYGRQESRFWPVSSEHQRRATYLEDQLAYAKPGFELALLKSQPRFRDFAVRSRASFRSVRLKLEGKSVLADGTSGLVTTGLFCVALYFIFLDTRAGAGSLFAGLVGLMSGVSAMAGVGYQVGELLISIPANRHLRAFLASSASACTTILEPGDASLQAQGVTVRYGDLVALDNVTLSIAPHQMVAVVGENGAGKTSFIKALMNVQPDASGTVRVGGTPIDLAAEAGVTYPFGILWQDFNRYEVSIREFLSLGVDPAILTDEAMWAALAVAEADGFVARFEDGLDARLGTQWGGAELSGGQWQRLAIARVVLADRPFWFLDEPTSAIDALAEESIIRRLGEVARERTVILTSHRVAALRSVDRIVVLKGGRLVESGTFDELLAGDTEFRRMFAAQLDVSGSKTGD